MSHQTHWNAVYENKGDEDLSWFQANPQTSFDLICASLLGGRVIDVGGGTSRLVDLLLPMGFAKLAVLDVSGAALDRARTRLGPCAEFVEWIEADITNVENTGAFDLWHDRAVFHFLTDQRDREHYS